MIRNYFEPFLSKKTRFTGVVVNKNCSDPAKGYYTTGTTTVLIHDEEIKLKLGERITRARDQVGYIATQKTIKTKYGYCETAVKRIEKEV